MYSYSKQRVFKKTLVFSAGIVIFVTAQASTVIPPPLPTGTHMVRQHAGVNPEEVRRAKRAHHHKGHHRKDITRDDTIDDVPDDNDIRRNIGKHISLPKTK